MALVGPICAAAWLAISGDARACINGVEEMRREQERHEPPYRIDVAHHALDRGHFVSAAAQVLDVYPGIRDVDARKASLLVKRALRVLALAIVRSEGKAGGWARAGNLEWAWATLAEIQEKSPKDPIARADLAEATAALPRDHGAALEVLEDLDQRDLLGSVHAYLALAALRRERGDEGGALAAVRRCVAMSTNRERCALPEAKAAGKET